MTPSRENKFGLLTLRKNSDRHIDVAVEHQRMSLFQEKPCDQPRVRYFAASRISPMWEGRQQPIQKLGNVNRVNYLSNENRQFLAASDRNRLVVAKTPPALDSMATRKN